ncbi:MAG: small subunit ribosomal protein S24e [Archaeoglobi archaeon]|nr:small subunit ribosomal protein S24e [Archaeoglobi archaeon]MDK2782295.1 small subunit ribosomal protein S24e [Archaeoglobi archaeon]
MEIEIVEEKENKLLRRREIRFRVKFDGPTPKREDVKKKLCAMLGVSESLTVIQSLEGIFGKSECSGFAKIYENEEDLRRTEEEHVIRKNFPEKEEEAEESQESGEG